MGRDIQLRLFSMLTILAAGCDGGASMIPGEGVLGRPDAMPGPSTAEDIDGDGVPNGNDNCPSLANADQRGICAYPSSSPAPTGDVADDAVALLNFYRVMMGLDPVVEDPEQSRTCQLHVDYLRATAAEMGGPYLAHQEDPASPHFTEEGNRAGLDSVLSYGQSNIGGAIDGWLDTLYHRLPLIDPGLREIGVAYSDRYACLQYRSGTVGSVTSPHAVLWPIPDGDHASPTFPGNEGPCPTAADPLRARMCPGSGTIVTLGLHDANTISDVTGHLRRVDTGEEQPLFQIWYDGGPSDHEQAGYLEHTIGLVPEIGSRLAPTEWEAEISATVDGAPHTFRWRFGVDPL